MMFEYRSEILNISPKGFKIVKTVGNHADTAKLDELINERAVEGWELVTHHLWQIMLLGVSTLLLHLEEQNKMCKKVICKHLPLFFNIE